MQMPTLLNNDPTAFVLAPVEMLTDLEHTYCSLFVDCLLDPQRGDPSAHFWLDRSDQELATALDRIYEKLFSFRKNDACWALKRLFGSPPKPPTVSAVRRFLRALASLPEFYCCRRNERHEAQRRDEDEAKNGAPAEADEDEPAEDEVELAKTEASDDNGCSKESSAARSEAGSPAGDNNRVHEQNPHRFRIIALDANRRPVRSKQQGRRIPLIPKEPQARAAFIRCIAERASRNGGKFPTPHSADWPEFEQALTKALGSIHLDVEDGLMKIVP
ncbi:hypothetical protein QA639_28805 [Bradyrhizobium pachyrhizi]|uniref:hypothetical protein n=1 Tax=Bradyrhizobium pachyrhizi TaxID=280333 RepID=UPI0024B17280|nr:hypothetical protein [Bradyrhizobium pachyrhizi]WFU53641.1 hypothetical protein QA639_28805 [Bradyrhizobium pachyrhizi]